MDVSVDISNSGIKREEIERILEQAEIRTPSPEEMPFLRLTEEKKISRLREIAGSLKEKSENLIVVGMGGSSLGIKALREALGKGNGELIILDNVDPTFLSRTLEKIDLKRCSFAFISKSGKTLETVTIMNLLISILKKAGTELKGRTVFIGNRGNAFEEIAKKESCPFITVPEEVGGRFSIFTAVGVFPSLFAGYDVDSLFKGARKAVEEWRLAGKLAAVKFIHYLRGRNISVMMPYSSLLREFTEWYAQLWGESLGKERKGQTPMKAIGTSSQHSVLQLFLDGPDDKIYQLFKIKNYRNDVNLPAKSVILPFLSEKKLSEVIHAEFEGTVAALKERKRPLITFELEEISEETLGYLFMLYMIATVITGKLMKVNPYGQPAVELGKRVATAILEGQRT